MFLAIFIIPFVSSANWISLGVPFSATWNTSANSSGSTNTTTIKLPVYSGGIYNFTVNWGDGKTGNVTTFNSVNATHTYASAGVYTINITGTINGFRFANTGDRLKIMNVTSWGDLQLGNQNGYFYGCSNLNFIGSDNLNLTGITNFMNMFRATNFTGNINNWDTSNITTMESMFNTATNFNSNISNWNTGKVINMTSMFNLATNFNQDISNWNTSNVVSMNSMFSTAVTFDSNISNWNTGKVKDMNSMFLNSNFNQPIGNWNTSSVTNMGTMFRSDDDFNQNINNWDTGNVLSMDNMFNNATNFSQPIGNWNTGKVTTMLQMFKGATLFNQNLSNWNTSNLISTNSMFYLARNFNGNISNWNTSNVNDTSYMFGYAYNFNQPLNWNTGKDTTMKGMFLNASNFNQPIGNWNTGNVNDMGDMFNTATSFNQPIGNWNTSSVTKMGSMFYIATNFNQNLTGWNTSKVTTLTTMFAFASNFNGNVSTWDTSSVNDMSYAFDVATNFNQDISKWNTSSVTTMANMFALDPVFNQNISAWDTNKVNTMTYMFYNDTAFNQSIGNWNTGNVKNMGYMFQNDISFNQNIGTWNVTQVTSMINMFSGDILSTPNYNSLLQGWASLSPNLHNNVIFDAGGSTYSNSSIPARNLLINFHNWNINDGGLYIDTIPPNINVSISQVVIYYGQNITFIANYSDNNALNSSIFAFDTLPNQTFLISGLTNQTVVNQMITQPAGTNISWYFGVYDLFGNYNQSATQSFIVQSIPTSLSLSTDKSIYEQAYKNISLFPIYIDLEAKYYDTLNNQSVLGASCFVSNSETNQLDIMSYNSTTGNYSFQMPTTEYYGNVTFNVSCQNSNYVSQNTSKSVDVYFYAYLWDSTNKTLYNGQSTNIYLSRTLPNSTIIDTLSKNVVVGDNLLADFNYYGSGNNGSFNRQYILTGNKIFNISASLNSSTCQPYVCFYERDLLFNKIYKTCGSPQSIIPNQFNYISLIDNTTTTLLQGSFIGIELRANCSVSQNLDFSYVANTSAYPAITFTSAQPFVTGYIIIDFGQVESNNTIYANTKINSSRWAVLNITNNENSSYQQMINFAPRFDAMYVNSIIPNTTYIYNSTKNLFASDNSSVNPFELATIEPSNQISWLSEMMQPLSSINESVNASIKDAITDDEVLTFDNGITKIYNISIGAIFTSTLSINNLTVISNYSTYGIILPNDLTIYYTNSTGTYNITNQVTIDTVNKYFIMPEIPSFKDSVNYEIIANRELVPPVFTTIPPDAVLFYGNESLGVQFISTDNVALDTYAVNDTRFSIDNSGFLSNVTSLAVGNYQLNITINDTLSNINWTIYNVNVMKSLDNCQVLFNETSPLAYPNTFLVGSDCSSPFNLYRNGTLITNNTEQVLPISAYNFSVERIDTQNYTNTFDEKELLIMDLTPPTIIVYDPTGNTENYNETIAFGIGVNDTSNNISVVKAFVTKPDNTTEEVQMLPNPSQGTYAVENITVEPSQICNASFGIIGGIPVAITSISGNGTPSTDTLCSFIAQKPLFGDFIATVSYNLTSLTTDSAVNFQVTSEEPTSANAVIYAYIGRTNFAGEGNQYQVYGTDNTTSGFLNKNNTLDTYGKMRIQRVNNTFSFFVYNNSNASWILLGTQDYDMHKGIFLVVEAESTNDNWGNANVAWSNFTFSNLDPQTYVGTFNDTSEQGTYYVQYFANDTKNNINNYTSAIFRINESNYPPSIPFITSPANSNIYDITVANQNIPITWAKVVDVNNDIVMYNISLLNADHTFNRTIVDNYGSLSSDNYQWNAYQTVPSGNYSIEVEVEETLTAEKYNKSDIMSGYFTLNQIDIVPPIFTTIPADASIFYGNESLNVQFVGTDNIAFDSYAVNDTAIFQISPSGFLTSITALPVGHYQINVTINDTSNNINWTIYNIEVKAQPIPDTTPPVITIVSPLSIVNSQTVIFSITTNELSTCSYNLDNNGNISLGTNTTSFVDNQFLSYGSHNVWYYCHDNSNNNNSVSKSFNIPQPSNGDIITGSSIPVAERFVSLVVFSPTFNFDTSDAVSVQALNPNGNAILLDNVSIELVDINGFTKSIITLNANDTYKRSFTVENNENITQLHFLITATKGDKTITQDYYTNIIQGSFLNRVEVDTIDFLTRYILYIGLFFLLLILLVIIRQSREDKNRRSKYRGYNGY